MPVEAQPLLEFAIVPGRPHGQHSAGAERHIRGRDTGVVVESGVLRDGERGRAVVHIQEDCIEGGRLRRTQHTPHVAELDPLIVDAADNWRIERMNVLDRLILRLAVYEFLHEPETPGKVIINEALELARSFSADDSVRFINGILDAIRRTLSRE